MICDICGDKTRDGAKSCGNCGAAVPEKPDQAVLDAMLEGQSYDARRGGLLRPSIFDRVMMWFCYLIIIPAYIVAWRRIYLPSVGIIMGIMLFLAGFMAGKPSVMWQMQKANLSRDKALAGPKPRWHFRRRFTAVLLCAAALSLMLWYMLSIWRLESMGYAY
jgi:hypothetical protein